MRISMSRYAWGGWAASLVLGFCVSADASIINAKVTAATDPIIGVAATVGSASSAVAAVGTTPTTNNYPAAEAPPNALDAKTSTKYLNFAETNAGLILGLSANGPCYVTGLRFATANDHPDRDPLTVVLEGTNAASPNAAATSATWTLLYSGVSGLATDPGRLSFAPAVSFANTNAFDTYRLLVATVRDGGAANSFQFSEVELIGSTVPEPATVGLLSLGMLGLLARRHH